MPKTVKFTEATRLTDKLENAYVKSIELAYQQALTEIDVKIRKAYIKYGVDGKFSYDAMMKMTTQERRRVTRLQALEKNIMDDLNKLNRGTPQSMSGYLTDVYTTNYTVAGQTLANVAKVNLSFDIIDREAVYKSILRPMAKIGLEDNADRIRRAIKRDITSSIVQGENIQSMSKRIRQSLETNANNAVRIARTETTGVMGNARADMLKDAESRGVKTKKIWLSTNDSRTRDRHLAMNEERAENDKPFSNGLMYPGDQSGPAKEVVNCRCALIAEVIDDE